MNVKEITLTSKDGKIYNYKNCDFYIQNKFFIIKELEKVIVEFSTHYIKNIRLSIYVGNIIQYTYELNSMKIDSFEFKEESYSLYDILDIKKCGHFKLNDVIEFKTEIEIEDPLEWY